MAGEKVNILLFLAQGILMKWRDYYDQRLTTPTEAVKAVKSGDRVVFSHACGEPKSLVDAMVAPVRITGPLVSGNILSQIMGSGP